VLDLCATMASITVCKQQVVYVDEPLAGPDGRGYHAAAIEERFIPLKRIPSARPVSLTNNGVTFVKFPRGIEFPYHGNTYTGVYVGANGGLRLTSGTIPASNVVSLPTTSGGSAPHISPFWDALDVESGGRVWTLYQGDRFIVSWEDVAHATGGGDTISFQAHLFFDGRIEFHYADTDFNGTGVDDGASATIGTQSPTGLTGLVASANSSSLLGNTKALAFAQAGCLASALRVSDDTPCTPNLAVQNIAVAEACGDRESPVAMPSLPTLCRLPEEAFIRGTIEDASGSHIVVADELKLPPGAHTVEWAVYEPIDSPTGLSYAPLTRMFSQEIEVQEVRSAALCCADSQTRHTLTSSNNIASYGAAGPQPVCVEALSGNDQISAGSSDDVLMGNEMGDTLSGGGGADRVYGGSGDDTCYGGSGDDIVYGDGGEDSLFGDAGADELRGGPDDDELDGGDDADTLIPGSGLDTVLGDDGDDVIVILHACELESGEVLNGGSGTDRLLLPAGMDLSDLTTAGVTVLGIESTAEVDPYAYGVSDCDTQGDLAISED
jgi:hypothetical protein